MAIVYGFTALFLFVCFMVWRGSSNSKDKSLELDVESMPHEAIDDKWDNLTDDDKRIITLKVNYFDTVAKLVFYREEDGTEGVYFRSKKNQDLGWATSLDKINITKQENGNNGNK